ncbi:MAG: CopD family protein [Acetobacteraceae bacterium]|nr:CopD family protein [Acetobacteraceae bacterium]
MSLLVDVFGYLSIILHGLVIVGQSMAVGSVLFLLLLAYPFERRLPEGSEIVRQTARLGAWSALFLVGCEALNLGLQLAVLQTTLDLPLADLVPANFAVAGLVKIAAASLLAVALFRRRPAPWTALLVLVAVILAAALMTTHAAARLEDRRLLMAAGLLHMLGAAIWIGGIPAFVLSFRRLNGSAAVRLVGARFSRMSMAGVGCILISAVAFSIFYIGSLDAVYGTAYGVMVSAKAAMFGALLLLGLGNFLVIERLRRDPATSTLRLRRFAEVEIGVGITIFFAAASLTSVPPAVDLTQDRVSWHEIVERNLPAWPRLTSPDHDKLALPALQAQLDREGVEQRHPAAAAFVPGSGELPARNAEDIAWSEYNHHWAGIFVTVVGLLALLHRAGVKWARHWPLAFLGMAVFLFFRSDPEVWPLGQIGFADSLRDVEVLQHRTFVLLLVAFALFEWGVRTGRLKNPRAALVFPVLTAVGAALLLTHNHAIANVREQLLIEVSHTPLALAGVAAGWSRWLELRADGPVRRWAGWVWPSALVIVGGILINYREASTSIQPGSPPAIASTTLPHPG